MPDDFTLEPDVIEPERPDRARPAVLDAQVRMRIGPLTLGCVQCLACRNRDPETRDLHAFLVERYRDAKEYG